MRYDDVIKYIFSLRRFSNDVIHDPLARHKLVRQALELNGINKTKFKIVHVAGTNGKGSVSTKISTALQSMGFKVGLFTSPHIVSFRERIRVNGTIISRSAVESSFNDSINCFLKNEGHISPLFFEICLLIALNYFNKQGVEWVVLEAGMGGGRDVTSAIEAIPQVSVVTSVGWDHMGILGNTLGEIAKEKSMIIRSGAPAVIGPQAAKFSVFKERALVENVELIESVEVPGYNIDIENSLIALLSLKTLQAQLPLPDMMKLDENLMKCLLSKPPLRLQSLSLAARHHAVAVAQQHFLKKDEINSPLMLEAVPAPEIVFDVGHNQTALEKLYLDITRLSGDSKHIRLVVSLSHERSATVLLPLILALKNKLSGIHYIDSSESNPRIRPFKHVLEECECGKDFYSKQEDPNLHIFATFLKESVKNAPKPIEPVQINKGALSAAAALISSIKTGNSELVLFCGSFFMMEDALSGMGLLPAFAEGSLGESLELPDIVYNPPSIDNGDALSLASGAYSSYNQYSEDEINSIRSVLVRSVNKCIM